MTDAGASVAGGVTVSIEGDLTPFQAALARAEALATAFDARMSAILGGVGGNSGAFAGTSQAASDASAAIAKIAAPAAAASAAIESVEGSSAAAADAAASLGISIGKTSIGAAQMTEMLSGAGVGARNLQAALAGMTAVSDEAAVATTALAAATGEYAVASASAAGVGALNTEIAATAKMSSAASVELTRAFGDAARGNVGRLESALLVLPTRLGEAGVAALSFKGALSAIGTIAEVAFNPVVLALIGIPLIAEAAIKFFSNMHGSEENQAEEALKRQRQYVDDITKAFPEAGKALEDYLAKAKEITPNAALVENADLASAAKKQFDTLSKEINEAVASAQNKMLASVKGVDLSGLFKFDPAVGEQIKTLTSELDAGSINAKDMKESLSGIKLDPDTPAYLQGALTALIGIVNAAADAQGKFAGLTDNAKLLDTELSREFAALGQGNPKADPNGNNAKFAADNLAAQAQSAAEYRAKLASINASTPSQKRAAAEQSEAVTLDSQTGISTALRQQEIAQAGQLAYAQAQKTLAGASTKSATAEADAYKRTTDALNLQLKTLGLTDEQKMIDDELSKAKVSSSSKEGQALTALTSKYYDQKQAIAAANEAGAAFAQTLESGIEGLITGGQSLADVLGNIGKQLVNNVLQAELLGSGPLAGLLGTAPTTSGQTGGLFSGIGSALAGLFGGGSTLAPGAGLNWAAAALPHYAAGTNSAIGGPSIINEKGPELINLPSGAQVIPASQTQAMMAANSNGTFTLEQHFHVSGAITQEGVANMVNAGAQQAAMGAVAAVKKQMPGWNAKLRVNGAL